MTREQEEKELVLRILYHKQEAEKLQHQLIALRQTKEDIEIKKFNESIRKFHELMSKEKEPNEKYI